MTRSRGVYDSEIYADAHLLARLRAAHLHEDAQDDRQRGTGITRRLAGHRAVRHGWLRPDLDQQRIHGYSVGRLTMIDPGKGELRRWPRRADKTQGGDWEIHGDTSLRLDKKDQGTLRAGPFAWPR